MNNKSRIEPTLVVSTDKSGRKYAYEILGHTWDKEKKRCVTTKRYYGTVDTDGRVTPKKTKRVSVCVSEDDEPQRIIRQSRIGMTRMLGKLAADIGLQQVLSTCFPKTWKALLALAVYHCATGSNIAYLFDAWAENHENPLGEESLSSQHISELYKNLDESKRQLFLKAWREASSNGGATFHDITSISSYSMRNEAVEYGYNRDKEDLPQINLAMIVDAQNRLPLYYQIHDGSVTDVTTLRNLLRRCSLMDMKKLTVVMDKGFYSAANISALYTYGYHFIVSMTMENAIAHQAVDAVRQQVRSPRTLIRTANGEHLYAMSVDAQWDAKATSHPCRIHVYTKNLDDNSARNFNFDLTLQECLAELNAGEPNPAHAALYAKYFVETNRADGSKAYDYNNATILKTDNRYSGYLCIITDDVQKDATEVLDIYRDKDGVEKVFDDAKNANDCKRLNIQSRPAMEGKLFVLFLSSILTSAMRFRLRSYNGKDWTLEAVRRNLDKICRDTISSTSSPPFQEVTSIITKTQRMYLSALLQVPESNVEAALLHS